MKYLLLGLLIVALVVLSAGAAGCGSESNADNGGGSIELQPGPTIVVITPTPTPGPGEWQLGPGTTIVLVTPTPPPGEGEIRRQITGLYEMVEPPELGDMVEVLLNCEAGAEELIILGQYLEMRYYIGDLNALEDQAWKAFNSWLQTILWWWPFWDIVPEQGLVGGILQVDCDKVISLPFVANVGVLPEPGDWEILEELLRELAVGDIDAVITLSEELTR